MEKKVFIVSVVAVTILTACAVDVLTRMSDMFAVCYIGALVSMGWWTVWTQWQFVKSARERREMTEAGYRWCSKKRAWVPVKQEPKAVVEPVKEDVEVETPAVESVATEGVIRIKVEDPKLKVQEFCDKFRRNLIANSRKIEYGLGYPAVITGGDYVSVHPSLSGRMVNISVWYQGRWELAGNAEVNELDLQELALLMQMPYFERLRTGDKLAALKDVVRWMYLGKPMNDGEWAGRVICQMCKKYDK